jgi:hypothetical protein
MTRHVGPFLISLLLLALVAQACGLKTNPQPPAKKTEAPNK